METMELPAAATDLAAERPGSAIPGARTAFGLWLLEAGALVAGAALLASVGALSLLHGSEAAAPRPGEGGLLPILRRALPGLRVALLAGFLAWIAGSVVAASEGPRRARAAALGAAAAFLASVAATLSLGGFAALLTLRPARPLAFAAVLATAVGWWLALAHAGAAATAAGRPDLSRAARRCRAAVAVGGLWLAGALALARAFARVRDAGAPHAALGTTLLVAGLGLLAHAALTVSGTLRVLTVLRETLAPPPRA